VFPANSSISVIGKWINSIQETKQTWWDWPRLLNIWCSCFSDLACDRVIRDEVGRGVFDGLKDHLPIFRDSPEKPGIRYELSVHQRTLLYMLDCCDFLAPLPTNNRHNLIPHQKNSQDLTSQKRRSKIRMNTEPETSKFESNIIEKLVQSTWYGEGELFSAGRLRKREAIVPTWEVKLELDDIWL
jgi:hypothetical protein